MKSFLEQVDQLTSDFSETFGSLSYTQLNWKPEAQIWSIAQNIHHLIIINDSYVPILESIRQGTYQPPWHAGLSFIVAFMGKTVLKAVEPERRKKMKTFPIWEPTQSNLPEDILHLFQQQQERLKERIINSQDLIVARTIIHSPANRVIVYTLETAFEIMIAHERRHLNQAKDVLSQMT